MQAPTTAKEVSVKTVITVLQRHKLLVAAAALIVTTGFVIYAVLQPTRYMAQAILGAEPMAVNDYVKSNLPQAPINVQDRLWLIRERLFSPTVLEPLIEEYHLDQDTDDIETRLATLTEELAQRLPFFSRIEPVEQNREEETIEALKSKITIRVEAADAFSLGFEGKDRDQTAAVANQLADSLVERTSAASEESASSAAGFLKAEAERVKQQLDQQNQTIQSYRERTADDLPSRMAGDLKVLEDTQEQVQAKTEQIANEQANRVAVMDELQGLENRGALDSRDKSAAQSKLEELQAKLKELRSTYTAEYPEIRDIQKEISDLEKATAPISGAKVQSHAEPSPAEMRYVELKAELGAIDQRLDSYKKQQNDLSSEMAVYRQKAEQAPETERTLGELVRDYELTRTQYQSLLEKQNQAQLDERLDRGNQGSVFRIVSQARPPLFPSGPHRVRITLLGLMSGLAVGVGLAFLADLRDTSYNTADEFQESTTLPVLSVIPSISIADHAKPNALKRPGKIPRDLIHFRSIQGDCPKETVVTLNDPTSIAAEQYGILAVEVRHRLGRDASRILAVTSPAGGEGKTITSLNLSIALSRAMEGQVLLVESDLRKPRLHEYLGFQPKQGFSDLLQKPDASIDDYIWRINGLSMIPAGPVLEEPLRFLASPSAKDIFARFRQRFQLIVVDSPPIVPIADSHVLSELADGVILVVRARQTRRELLQHALQNFHASNILGVVLNGADLRQSRYYYAYDYYSEHYLGEGKRKRA